MVGYLYFHSCWSLDLSLRTTLFVAPVLTCCTLFVGTALPLVRPVHEQFLILILDSVGTWSGARCNCKWYIVV